jgi:hypothetical protein
MLPYQHNRKARSGTGTQQIKKRKRGSGCSHDVMQFDLEIAPFLDRMYFTQPIATKEDPIKGL